MHIIAPHFSCIVQAPVLKSENSEFDQAVAQGYVEIYVVGQKGITKYHKLRGENRFVTVKVDKIPGVELAEPEETFRYFLPAGRIPRRILDQIEFFFRKVMEVHKNDLEAMIWVLYSPQQGYYLHVPDQRISKAAVSYNWHDVPSGSSIVVDCHSHNSMSAFFSGTDNADDKSGIRFSGVFGKLDQPEAMTVWRFNYMDKKMPATISDIFEEPEKAPQEIPAEWLGKIKIQTVAPALRVTHGHAAKWSAHGSMYGYTPDQLNYARQQRRAVRSVDDFNGDFWGFENAAYQSLYGDMEAEVTGGVGKAKPRFYDLDSPEDVKEIRGQYIPDAPAQAGQVGDPSDEYANLAAEYGPDAADAFWDIQQCVTLLENSDDLLTSVVEEACGMMKDPQAKLTAMRRIYESLNDESRDKLAANGL